VDQRDFEEFVKKIMEHQKKSQQYYKNFQILEKFAIALQFFTRCADLFSKINLDYMKSNGIPCTPNTIGKWIGYLSEAYIIDEIPRYSKKAKKELEQSKKIYNSDVALNSIRCLDNRFDMTHNLENAVYNELVFMGYNLSVYDNNGREIDFIAEKENQRFYIQVAFSIAEEKAYERELTAFNSLTQRDRKIIITNDEIDYSTSNIDHIKLKDFLMMESLG